MSATGSLRQSSIVSCPTPLARFRARFCTMFRRAEFLCALARRRGYSVAVLSGPTK